MSGKTEHIPLGVNQEIMTSQGVGRIMELQCELGMVIIKILGSGEIVEMKSDAAICLRADNISTYFHALLAPRTLGNFPPGTRINLRIESPTGEIITHEGILGEDSEMGKMYDGN